ncbi:uncharacterized protein MONBRDRAFT_26730 [Monosiga brevicollis MX1]|uniref:Ricin B lectin domain-containing protein n=1 Tax=Monosiga brevicollis TaxID=81824 RepID=A9V373_MONBE|nr:uncharacterized protein MONBRDRAFT_26730 [Monosiga brevicollis MX1]EDQ88138.1 predicted protein [Monosiga brevicollis MX1]|eukprot:XP_001747214.1 hypothetical protein [Monosiga brevicollis MX1]
MDQGDLSDPHRQPSGERGDLATTTFMNQTWRDTQPQRAGHATPYLNLSSTTRRIQLAEKDDLVYGLIPGPPGRVDHHYPARFIKISHPHRDAHANDRVHQSPCDLNQTADAQQGFRLKNKQIMASSQDLCFTIAPSKPDPESGTPEIILKPCKTGNMSQEFFYNTSSMQLQHLHERLCLDLDSDDSRVELYPCQDQPSTNEQWLLNITNRIVSAEDDQTTCLAACRGIAGGNVGTLANISLAGKHAARLETDKGYTVLLESLAQDVIRVQFEPFGSFTAATDLGIVLNDRFDTPPAVLEVRDHVIKAGAVTVTVSHALMGLEVTDAAGNIVLSEIYPLTWNTSSLWQTIALAQDEQIFGGGMQNGYWSHRGRDVLIEEVSTAGYGVLRNTYAHGMYAFHRVDEVTLRHDEARFDAVYFFGPPKRALDLYTQATGRPFMPPLWGLTLGDSDCYNSHNRTTKDVVKVAQAYDRHQMPGGWMIMNDGYGCGYEDLEAVIASLHRLGKYTALWTSTGLANATWEIGTAGSRGIKTDVGWVGAGYRFELDAVKLATSLIENNSNARRYIWTVCGWAGTHHYAVMWNGDNTGSWEYIRFQIPTVLGSAFSAQAYTSGDVDGIFGGAPETYVRDLQWKVFLPVLMTMSGWATYNKQPFVFGEPYTSYNRDALDLKMRLLPYQYSYSYQAYLTGLAMARPLCLEFPAETQLLKSNNVTDYLFMSGEWFLVAPMYENSTHRNDIYLPGATTGDSWFDYWSRVHYKVAQ